MSIPSGTVGAVPFVIDKTLISSSFTNFPYLIDLSDKLTTDADFKAQISSASNIAIYDESTGTTRPRIVNLNLLSNKLYICFDGPTTTSENRTFYVCVGGGVSQSDSASALGNSGYLHHWNGRSVSGGYALDVVGGLDGLITGVGSGTGLLGESILFGSSGDKIVVSDPVIDDGDISIEFIMSKASLGIGTSNPRILHNGEFEIYLGPSGAMVLKSGAASTTSAPNQSILTVDSGFHHVIITRDSSGNTFFYIDGLDQTLDSTSVPTVASLTNLYIGNRNDSARTFDGELDLIGINTNLLTVGFAATRTNMLNNSNFFTIGDYLDISGAYGSNYDYGESPKYKDEDAGAVGIPIITTPAINDSIMVSV